MHFYVSALRFFRPKESPPARPSDWKIPGEPPKPKRKAVFGFSGSSLIGRWQNPKMEFFKNATLKCFDGAPPPGLLG